jgi:hypothetical protein
MSVRVYKCGECSGIERHVTTEKMKREPETWHCGNCNSLALTLVDVCKDEVNTNEQKDSNPKTRR